MADMECSLHSSEVGPADRDFLMVIAARVAIVKVHELSRDGSRRLLIERSAVTVISCKMSSWSLTIRPNLWATMGAKCA